MGSENSGASWTTWAEFYELLQIGDASAEICIEGFTVDVLDPAGQERHGCLDFAAVNEDVVTFERLTAPGREK